MFERIYEILPSDVGARGEMKPRSLLDCLQNTADIAVKALRCDTHAVLERGYAWVVVSGNMRICRWASLGEKIAVRTWHNATDGLYTYRAFDVRDSSGVRLGEGATSWILIDLARGRPVKPKQNLPEEFSADSESNPEVSQFFETLPREPGSSENRLFEKNFEVRTHDLDSNDHVNNAVYLEWAVEAAPERAAFEKTLLGWEVNYRKSARSGDTVRVMTSEHENVCTSLIYADAERGKFLCTVRTFWK